MKTAVVTGASSGIGADLCKYLLDQHWSVIGLARDFSKLDIDSPNFEAIVCDLSSPTEIKKAVTHILSDTSTEIHLLINNAGLAHFAPHEEHSVEQIITMTNVNLRAPLILSNLLLRQLKKHQGYLINILSVTARKISPWGGVYAATKAGLLHFSENLADEVRKSGVRVVSILPDITDTPFYEDKNFEPDPEHALASLTAADITDTLDFILKQQDRVSVTEISLRPRQFRIQKK